MKTKLLIQTIASGETISKEKLTSDEIKHYKVRKLERIQDEFKKENVTLIETYELWQQNNSIKEIAAIRKLTTQTIHTHLAKLIENQTISISDVLPEDKIQELAKAFEGYNEDSLNPLKEKYGDRFTWDELKLFKASFGRGNETFLKQKS